MLALYVSRLLPELRFVRIPAKVLLDVQRLPTQARVSVDALLQGRVQGEQRRLDLALIVEPLEELELILGEREDGAEQSAGLIDEVVRRRNGWQPIV